MLVRKIIKDLNQMGQLSKIKKDCQVINISVVLLGKKRMREINFKYRGKNYVTDVLSFSYLNSFSHELYLGEIVINPEKAKFQANQYGVSLWQEMKRLLVHGILHLFGYDHEVSLSHARKMQKIEEKILQNL
jgi:probable rRNA maturation factor